MLNGRSVDNALLESISKKGSSSYYYAHAPKDFTTEGAQHFKGDGKIYGGDPVLIKTRSPEEVAAAKALAEKNAKKLKTIKKFSWADEDAKVKIYIDFEQFGHKVEDAAVEVKFDEYLCDITITDASGMVNQLQFYK